MKIVIFGANGPVGKILTEMALREGHEVTAVTRRPDGFPVRHDKLQVQAGDVLDESSVTRAVAGQDVVLSLYGVPYSRKPMTVYSQGMKNILAAMKSAGVRRLVCVTSGGTNPHHDLVNEGLVFGLILKPFIGRTLYEDMRRMEAIVMESDCDWTIVRPAQLVDTPDVTKYHVFEGYMVPKMRKTSRADLAHFMLEQASSEQFRRKAVAVATGP